MAPVLVNGKNYENLIDELNASNDLWWVWRSRNFPQYKDYHPRTPQQIRDAVLTSERVKQVMRLESVSRGWALKHVEKEASAILDEMGHNMQMGVVRNVGYLLSKVIQRLFTGIFVNTDQLESVRDQYRQSPVILIPTHRTYLDFLIVSFLCFAYELPLPAIAAGQDFMQMRVVGELLRRCGAFFIRRSFGQDQLYWAVFTEYLQSHLRNGDMPLEFFIEGTRSRSGKSLLPKYGLFTALLEPYLRSQVYDLVILPVTLDYSRILEEVLFAYELLGFPKPQESTSGLFKATRILTENFGDMFVTFGEPMSVREYLGTTMHRSTHALEPYATFGVSSSEKRAIVELAHRVVKVHEGNSVGSLWPLASIAIEQLLAFDDDTSTTSATSNTSSDVQWRSVEELKDRVHRLLSLAAKLGHRVPFVNGESLSDQLNYYLQLHKNIITISHLPKQFSLTSVPESTGNGGIRSRLIADAVPHLIVANYANRAMHWFTDEAFVSIALRHRGNNLEEVKQQFRFLQTFFAREFICIPTECDFSFSVALRKLQHCRCVDESLNIVDQSAIDDLLLIIRPFLVAYWLVCRSLLSANQQAEESEKKTVRNCQKFIADAIEKSTVGVRYSMLNTDTIKNSLNALNNIGAIKIVNGIVTVVPIELKEVALKLERCICDVPELKSEMGFVAKL